MALAIVLCAVMAWVALDGPVLMAEGGDRMFKSLLLLIVAVTLVDVGLKLHRSVRPAPTDRAGA
jgi:hypothetical protein